MSLRLILTADDMALQAELRNISDTSQAAPELDLALLTEGQSLGTENYGPENEWVDVGGSVYYQWCCAFGGSLFIGDWDEVQIWLTPPYFGPPNMIAFSSLEIDGERITNAGTEAIGPMYFLAVLRDAKGIFSGSCFGPDTGANLLPGKSLRAPGLGDHSSPGGCANTSDGEDASESLGIGGPYTEEHVIAQIDDLA